jgi:3-oxoacyl-[acyl-carrier-protein] synthase II
MNRVVITGIGLITPLAIGRVETWKALLDGRSGAASITIFDASAFDVRFACEVKKWDATRFIATQKLKEMDRFTELAYAAAAMAIEDARLELTDEERDEAGCFIGSALAGFMTLENSKKTLIEKGPRFSPYSIARIIGNLASGQVSMRYGLKGPSYCHSSGCSSGSHALGQAFEWIRSGRSEVMVAGGAEAAITPVIVAGFDAMGALSHRNEEPSAASRPFSTGRDGLVLGEGSGVLVLETLRRAQRRGAKIYAELTGYGASTDGDHVQLTAPRGDGACRAMQGALCDARVSPQQIDYVNAHGGSTVAGDILETKAIAEVFGEHATSGRLWVSSTKSMTGHMLGASGAVESAISALIISEGRVPPTINLTEPDPECTLDYVANTARERRVKHVLKSSLGFGGTNCSLVFSRYEG